MNKEDREFIFSLNNCNSRQEIEELINEIDDDQMCIKMTDDYQQILEFNQEESIKSIKKILEFKYTKLRNESKEEI